MDAARHPQSSRRTRFGHLLGLDHSKDSTDIMFPTAKVRDLSDRDVRTVMLLYQLDAGEFALSPRSITPPQSLAQTLDTPCFAKPS